MVASGSSSSAYLAAFIFFDTLRALVSFGVVKAGVHLMPATLTAWAELCKFLLAVAFFLRWSRNTNAVANHPSGSLLGIAFDRDPTRPPATDGFLARIGSSRVVLLTAAPAALYLVNNILYLSALSFTSPALLGLAMMAKLPITAVLHYWILGKARCRQAWVSLVFLCLGLVSLHIPWSFLAAYFGAESAASVTVPVANRPLLVGSLIGMIIATLSGGTSILTEVLMKQSAPFWVIQIWLYLYGAIFAAIFALMGADNAVSAGPRGGFSRTAEQAFLGRACVVAATTATGIVIANILRKGDNLVKLVGNAASVVAALLLQPILWPDTAAEVFNPSTISAVGLVVISTWAYNFYKEQPLSQYILIPLSPISPIANFSPLPAEKGAAPPMEDSPSLQPRSEEPARGETDWSRPTPFRILGVASVFGLAAALSAHSSR